jgi:hypothetical protein
MARLRESKVDLPHPCLPEADWGDRFTLDISGRQVSAADGARAALGTVPAWIRILMDLRNLLVRPFGLKAAPDASLGPDRTIGAFPVISEEEERVVLGLDDRHLDFRIIIDSEADGMGGTHLSATTLVHRRNLFGRVYLAFVMPFHKRIVPAVLKAALRPT